ncbi:MAG: hypothetical protein GY765_08195 [bacterium]|nr:hypothetical protein [bacterium]
MTSNEKKKSRRYYTIASVICAAIIGVLLFSYIDSDQKEITDVGQMREMAQQVRDMESEVAQKEGEVIQLADQYKNKTGSPTLQGVNLADLNQTERDLLEQHIDKEKDVSIKGLLKTILLKKDEIHELREEIIRVESQLPTPYMVKKGDSHFNIALAFLVDQKGLEKEHATAVLRRTALFDELVPGFKVWNFYTADTFGTSVTQGDAKVSPNNFQRGAKKKLLEACETAVSQRDMLAQNKKVMEEKQKDTNDKLQQETVIKEQLAHRVSHLDKQVNSMFYRIGLQKNLEKKKILKSRFLASTKLKDVAPGVFDRQLDLTRTDELVIAAEDLGVKKIKDVVLYPRFHKKGISYKVLITSNKQHALLTLTDKEKFKSERIVIAVK